MSIISDVKCARCDRQYSGVRSRCPYCGARRIGSGKYTEDGDSTKGKMMIGVLILALFVVAAGFLLFTTPREEDDYEPGSISEPETETHTLPGSGIDNIDREDGLGPSITPTPEESEEPSETPTPTPVVQSITITYAGSPLPYGEFTEKRGNTLPLGVRIEPVGIDHDTVVWTSSNEGIFSVVASNTQGTNANTMMISAGTAELTVSVNGIEDTCTVRVIN